MAISCWVSGSDTSIGADVWGGWVIVPATADIFAFVTARVSLFPILIVFWFVVDAAKIF
jgi:hypothetical protein